MAAVFAVLAAGPADAQSVEDAEPSIVRVALILDSNEGRLLAGAGSGFVVAPNLVVTAAHVVAQARQQPEFQVAIVTQNDATILPARIIAFSPLSELALLEFRGANIRPVTLSEVEPHAGDPVVALGYPDVDFQGASGPDLLRPTAPSRTSGEIALLREQAPTGEPIPTINHQAVISSGSSGGPLLDQCGRVLGVNAWHVRGAETREARSVATRVPQLIDFLTNAGVTPQVTQERCLSEAERVEAQRVANVQALQEQNDELGTKLETANRLTQYALAALGLGVVALLMSLIVLARTLLRPRHEGAAAGLLSIMSFAGLTALVIAAGAMLLIRAQVDSQQLTEQAPVSESGDGGS